MIPGRTALIPTPTPPNEVSALLRKAVRAGVFIGDVGGSGFRLHAGPKLALAGKIAASQEEIVPMLRLARPSSATGATLMGRWRRDEAEATLTVTYVPPLYDFVLLVILVVVLGPVVVEAWARPGVDAVARWGTLAVLIGAVALVLGISWARMRRLHRALLQAVGG